MVFTVNVVPPGFLVATIAASAGLGGDEEGDGMPSVVTAVKTSGTHDTAIVQCTISTPTFSVRSTEEDCNSLAPVARLALLEDMATRPPLHHLFLLPRPSKRYARLVIAQKLVLRYIRDALGKEILVVRPMSDALSLVKISALADALNTNLRDPGIISREKRRSERGSLLGSWLRRCAMLAAGSDLRRSWAQATSVPVCTFHRLLAFSLSTLLCRIPSPPPSRPLARPVASASAPPPSTLATTQNGSASSSVNATASSSSPLTVPPPSTVIPGFHSLGEGHPVPEPRDAVFCTDAGKYGPPFYTVTVGKRVGCFGGWDMVAPYVVKAHGVAFGKKPTLLAAYEAYTKAYERGSVKYT
ncbi:hypothetical protein NMY22_g13091 [Coprinellus aureogranulatus]|nr:hypothetical protein NMY22_g13091 [Coprinellus aureogranulatus]